MTAIELTKGQQGVWAIQRRFPESSAYNCPVVIEFDQAVDTDCVKAACGHLPNLYPVLRTRVIEGAEGLSRTFDKAGADFRVERTIAADEDPRDVLVALAGQVFNIGKDRLWRVHLVPRAQGGAYVLFVVHHVIFDGGSAFLLVRSFLTSYRDVQCNGVEAQVSLPTPAQLPGSARQQDPQELDRCLAYWRNQFHMLPEPLDLPADRPRSKARALVGASLHRALNANFVQAVRALSRACSVYPSTAYLAAYALVLARLSGQDDFVLGVPFDERGKDEAHSIGLYINMLPVRIQIPHGVSFTDLLKSLQGRLFEAMVNATPFPDIVRALGQAGSEAPLFQQAFMYQNFVAETVAAEFERECMAPLGARLVHEVTQVGEYELALEVFDRIDEGRLVLKYSPDLIEVATGRRLLEQVEQVLVRAVDQPSQLLRTLSLITAEQRQALITAGRGPERPYPRSTPVDELFAAQAATGPDRIAVRCGQDALTYADLYGRALRLASRLTARGIGPGDRVAICLERSIEWVVALLGILKAGAAFLPLDPRLPEQRQVYMLSDGRARLMIASDDLAARLSVDIDRLAPDDIIQEANTSAPEQTQRDAASAAYVLFTSGSTGAPKGVVVPHRALVSFLTAMVDSLNVGRSDRFLAVTTFSFDISLLELLSPLVVGGECVICPAEIARDAERLRELIAQTRPSLMQATPTTWTMLLDAGWTNAEGARLLCGGEVMPEALRARFETLGSEIWNMYGPTETTIWSMAKRLVPGQPATLGGPIANTRVFVLDAELEPAPIGVPGELWIAGDGLASGYFDRPSLTAERFVPCPFGPDGDRMYRTGDLVRWRNDGELDFLGRIDTQVKVRGHRIELGEIEAALTDLPEVARAVVAALPGDGGVHRLIAYLVAMQGARIERSQIRGALKLVLPEYMMPTVIVELDAFPLTSNGKIDRKALPSPPTRSESQLHERPLTEMEKDLAAIWQEVLGLECIGLGDDFFDLGGHSLNGLQVVALVRDRVGLELPLSDLFEVPRIGDLAARLEQLAPAPRPDRDRPTGSKPAQRPVATS